MATYKRILVAVDGSACADRALAAAIELARSSGSRLRLAHVVEEMAYVAGYDKVAGHAGELLAATRDAGIRLLSDAAAKAEAAGVTVDHMLFDRIGERLGRTMATAAKLWDADLVVTGTHGRTGLSRLLMGSGAEEIMRLAPVPVLVVPADASSP